MTLEVIGSRLRAEGGEVVLRNKRYTKGSQNIGTQFPGAKADFEDLTVISLRDMFTISTVVLIESHYLSNQ